MKKHLIFCLFLFSTPALSAQIIYISSTNNELYRLDLANCSYDFVVEVQANVYDISFHPNGNLYGISGAGTFYEIDISTGDTSFIYDFDGQSFNSLTISNEGIAYTYGSAGALWSYDISNNEVVYYGEIGFTATGDLTFFDGNLYAAVSGDRIIKIDIDNLENSSVVIDEDVVGQIVGIVSFAEDCNNVNSYAITDGSSSIYQIDFATNSLDFVCELDIEVGGGASTFEFIASSPIVIQEINEDHPDCGLSNGAIQIEATGGIGQLYYSIDSVNFQVSGTFEGLAAGNYTIVISDDNSCNVSEEISLSTVTAPVITGVSRNNTTCGDNNGSITVLADGGLGELKYSIDGTNFQLSNVFDNLPIGNYSVTVIDENNCTNTEIAEILSEDAPIINDIDVVNATCGNDNARITILANGGTGQLAYAINGTSYQTSNVFNNLPAGYYSITVIDDNNCTETGNTEVLPEDSPVISDVTVVNTTCDNEDGVVTILASGGTGTLAYAIDGASYQASNVFEHLPVGSYVVSVVDDNGCTSMDEVVLGSSPELIINAIEGVAAVCGESNGVLMIKAEGVGEVQVALNGGAFQSDCSFEGLSAGRHDIEVTDDLGCIVDTSFVIAQEECPVFVPSAFSPDRDGVNDLFKIYPHPDFQGEFKSLKVFDRWGGIVFEAQDFDPVNTGWDGTHKERALETGVYIYFIEYRSINGDAGILKGEIAIVK